MHLLDQEAEAPPLGQVHLNKSVKKLKLLRTVALLTTVSAFLTACATIAAPSRSSSDTKEESSPLELADLPSVNAGELLLLGFEVVGFAGDYVYLKNGRLLAQCRSSGFVLGSSASYEFNCIQVR